MYAYVWISVRVDGQCEIERTLNKTDCTYFNSNQIMQFCSHCVCYCDVLKSTYADLAECKMDQIWFEKAGLAQNCISFRIQNNSTYYDNWFLFVFQYVGWKNVQRRLNDRTISLVNSIKIHLQNAISNSDM